MCLALFANSDRLYTAKRSDYVFDQLIVQKTRACSEINHDALSVLRLTAHCYTELTQALAHYYGAR